MVVFPTPGIPINMTFPLDGILPVIDKIKYGMCYCGIWPFGGPITMGSIDSLREKKKKVIETPKQKDADRWDKKNLEVLRALVV